MAEKEVEEEAEPKEEQPVVVVEYRVPMHCNACERLVAKTISKFQGVEKFTTQMHKHKVVVTGRDIDPEKLLKKLRKKTRKKGVEIVVEEEEEAVDDDQKENKVVVVVNDVGGIDGSGMEMVTTTAGVLVPYYYYYVWPWRHESYEVYFTAFSDDNANACSVM